MNDTELVGQKDRSQGLEEDPERSGPDHAPVFAARARSGLFFMGWVGGRTAKLWPSCSSTTALPEPSFGSELMKTARPSRRSSFFGRTGTGVVGFARQEAKARCKRISLIASSRNPLGVTEGTS